MTRRTLSNILSSEEQDLHDVWAWYEFQSALIGEEYSRVLAALSSGTPLPTSRYFGKTRDELDDDFGHQRAELGLLTTLGMLACTEAALRIDFIDRVRDKKKDKMSREFRSIYQKRRKIEKIRLDEDILDAWKVHCPNAEVKKAVGEFKGVLKLRHWLAHGRYWKPKLGRAGGYDAVDVFEVCNELLQVAGLL